MGSQHQQGWNLAEGLGYSVYFMLAMPFLLFGSFAAWIYWKTRRAKGDRDERDAGDNKP